MNYISVTELRTKSTELVDSLLAGRSVDLLYRSRVVGKVMPIVLEEKTEKKYLFSQLVRDLAPKKKINREEREAIYRNHLVKKYGGSIS